MQNIEQNNDIGNGTGMERGNAKKGAKLIWRKKEKTLSKLSQLSHRQFEMSWVIGFNL